MLTALCVQKFISHFLILVFQKEHQLEKNVVNSQIGIVTRYHQSSSL
jgi:hypothetical protein